MIEEKIMSKDMKMNESQLQAVHAVEGQLVIIACPGSGKTTTLLNRIHYMTNVLHIDPDSILVVTYSKTAVNEMKERYTSNFCEETKVYFGTIHSFCRAIIKKFSAEGAFIKVIEEQDVFSFFKMKLRNIQNIGSKTEFINDLKTDITRFKRMRCDMVEFTPKCTKNKELFVELYNDYEEYKENLGLIDFEDMMIRAYDILCNNVEALKWIRAKYKYVLVDEYQDINELQKNIIYKIAGENGNLTVVGDDDQAIYGFQGANTSIMLNFQRDYPNSKVIYLTTNYRSNREIVEAAGQVIKNNKARFAKEFVPHRGSGGRVQIIDASTRKKEIEELVSNIRKTIEEGVSPEEIAIIYRINKQGELIAKALLNENIDFKTNENVDSIYDHWIYKDILAFYRMSQGNGSKYDFEQTLNRPNRYLHSEKYKSNGPDKNYMIRVAANMIGEIWKKEKAIEQIKAYFVTLDAMKKAVTPEQAIAALILKGEYRNYLKECADFRNDDVSELNMILDELKGSAASCNSWSEWENMIAREKRELEIASKGKSGVTLTTMHSAKGLEWKVVYVIDCVDGKCPYVKAKGEEELEEERRLFYVAMTRAKDRLVLMHSKFDGAKVLSRSKYLKECGVVGTVDSSVKKNASFRTKAIMQTVTAKSVYTSPNSDKANGSAPVIAVGDVVQTSAYGEGTIQSVALDENGNPKKFVVHFVTAGDKTYMYPDAFSRGMEKK